VVSGGLAENGLGIAGNHKLRGSLRYIIWVHVRINVHNPDTEERI
jgi:hypothetical protein